MLNNFLAHFKLKTYSLVVAGAEKIKSHTTPIPKTMSFNEDFKTISKMDKSNSCPDECEFKRLLRIPAVWVPPPQNNPLIGMIISRDPTTAFISHYNDAKSKNLLLWRENLFDTNGIPKWTYDKIASFNRKYMEGALSEEELKKITNTIFNSVYWGHLHKCYSD